MSTEDIVKKVLEEERAKVHCQTCGHVFLDILLKDYARLTRGWQNEPDHWYVETGIHWAENPDHQILAELPLPVSITEQWDNKMELDNQTRKDNGEPPTSREIMLPHFMEYERKTRMQPI